jgi:hypothetical protein
MERGRESGALSERVIGCVIRVHRSLGPGFREKVYQRALVVEFANAGLTVELEASGLPLGLLINFSLERTDIRRLAAKRPPSEHEPPPLLPNSSPPHRRQRQEISLPRG